MRNQNLTRWAEVLQRQRDDLMLRWRNKVQQVPRARNLDALSASDHVAAVLDDVAAALLKGQKKPLVALSVDTATEIHGIERLREGFNLIDIVADYNALREAIQEFADSNHITITGRVRAILDRVLDKTIAVAAQTYSEQKALEIQKQREEHLSFIVHDLKTPLSAVSTAAKILERILPDEDKNERVTTMLQIVERNTQRLNALISRVIQETSLERAGPESVFPPKVEKRDLDLWPLIEALIHDLQPLTEPKRIRIRNDVPSNRVIFADPVLISPVFQNLLSNAIEYTSDGEIIVGAAGDEGQVIRCWVRDCGKGIPEDRLSKVFDKLETDPQRRGGDGLGLAIVKQVIEAHGGTISVTSKLGEGSSFEFVLPLPSDAPVRLSVGDGTAA
jgi:two-component system, OmpR family, phosphate regulon sensor histidine kinase PhoR